MKNDCYNMIVESLTPDIQFIYFRMNTDYSRTMSRFRGHMYASARQRIQAVFQEIFFTTSYHQVV